MAWPCMYLVWLQIAWLCIHVWLHSMIVCSCWGAQARSRELGGGFHHRNPVTGVATMTWVLSAASWSQEPEPGLGPVCSKAQHRLGSVLSAPNVLRPSCVYSLGMLPGPSEIHCEGHGCWATVYCSYSNACVFHITLSKISNIFSVFIKIV